MMKDELGGKIMIEIKGLKFKIYSYLIDDGCFDKKTKGIKKCVIKHEIKFQDYKENNNNDNYI